jgi:hypothetical protein
VENVRFGPEADIDCRLGRLKRNQDFLKEKTSAAQSLYCVQGAFIRPENRMEHVMQYKNRRSITTVNKHLPFVWRVNYLHEAPPPQILPEIAHEKARQILHKNLSRTGRQ